MGGRADRAPFSAALAVSDHVARSHATWFGSARIHVLRIPVSPLARPLSPPQTPPRKLGYLGALARVKGVSHLLEAAPQLDRLGLRVRIAGDGPMVEQVRRAAAAGVIDYVGLVAGEDKLRFMETCDLAVLPSVWDEPGGPPYAPPEWLAGGRPVLVANRGGLREFAERHRCVMTIEPTPSGLVESAKAVLAPGRFEELLAAVPDPEDGRELRSWLAGHRAIYELALRGRDANR
jgi:glycosyltransferase involved in cell wall biosynthesis